MNIRKNFNDVCYKSVVACNSEITKADFENMIKRQNIRITNLVVFDVFSEFCNELARDKTNFDELRFLNWSLDEIKHSINEVKNDR